MVGSLDDFRQTQLHAISTDRVTEVVRRIVDNEQQVPALDVAAFNSAM